MSLKFKSVLLFAIGILFILSATTTQANEGNAELRSSTTDDYRCFVNSQLTQERKYRLQVTCRDLVYPSDSTVFSYIMWGNPTDGGKIIKMGPLDFGKKLFNVNRPFSSIFVTTEQKPGVAIPEGPVVMQAPILPIEFLDRPTTPTPTPIVEEVIVETPTEATPVPEEQPSAVSVGLKRASIIIAVILLIGASAALVIIIRSKKR